MIAMAAQKHNADKKVIRQNYIQQIDRQTPQTVACIVVANR